VAVNDTEETWVDEIEVSRRTFAGDVLASVVVELAVPPAGGVRIPLPVMVAAAADPRTEVLVAGRGAGRALWFFAEDVELAYPAPEYTASVEVVDGEYRVTVVAGTLLRDLVLYADRLDPAAEVDDALVTLLPGESTVFTVRAAGRLDPDALARPPVLRSVAQLAAGSDPRG
jgi:beta-mannosidase